MADADVVREVRHANLSSLRRPQLQRYCSRLGVPATGTKDTLIARIQSILPPPASDVPPSTSATSTVANMASILPASLRNVTSPSNTPPTWLQTVAAQAAQAAVQQAMALVRTQPWSPPVILPPTVPASAAVTPPVYTPPTVSSNTVQVLAPTSTSGTVSLLPPTASGPLLPGPSASITAYNLPGELPGSYDVQSVHIESAPDSDRFEVSCTFISGSSAHSCLLTVCEQVDDVIINNSCINVTITRDPDWPTATQEVAYEFGSGVLSITAVAEVERDGNVTAVRLTSHSLGADDRNSSTPDITSSRVTTTHSGTIPLGGVKSKGKQHSLTVMISAGAGLGLLAVICVILTVVLTATWYRHHSRTKREVEPIYDEPYSLPPKPIPVYEEPCAVVSSLKKTELHMEHCPAYGIVPNRHTS